MKWNKIKLKTTTTAEDIASAILNEAGVEGVEIIDNIPLTEEEMRGMFVDISPITPVDDGIAYLSFYLKDNDEGADILKNAMSELEEMRFFVDMGDLSIEISKTDDEDWINNWKQYFHQFSIGDMLITPSWEKANEAKDYKLVLEIDPGTAFGTGKHETTRLCIEALWRYIKGDETMLDVGIGSGILGLAALKLGAGYVIGTDLDEMAEYATDENMARNDISKESYEVIIGNIIDETKVTDYVSERRYDIVTANILAEVLLQVTPIISKMIADGGIYITSGILNEKAALVEESMKEAGFEILEINELGEWTSIVGKRR